MNSRVVARSAILSLFLTCATIMATDTDKCFGAGEIPIGGHNLTANWTDSKLEFSLSMFHSLYAGENLFFSPHSIHQALVVALMGARGETEAQLRSLLNLENVPKVSLLQHLRADGMHRDSICPSSPGVELRVANKIFVDKSEPLQACVLTHLGPEVEQLDLKNDTEGSRAIMNKWVEEITHNKIYSLVPPLPPNSRLAIVNGAYFRGVWEHQFKKSKTKLGLFYSSPTEVVPTYMMHTKGYYHHGASPELGAYVLELPYEGDSMSLVLLLPPFSPGAITRTVTALGRGGLKRAMEELAGTSLEVVLPRFSLAHTLPLTQALTDLGLTSLFNRSGAELGDFSTKPEGLFVEEAIHKSFLEVNEEGASAGGGTALIGTRSGRPLDQSRFVANHPFILGVWDKCRETMLFMGVLHRPQTKGQGGEKGEGAAEEDATTTTTEHVKVNEKIV